MSAWKISRCSTAKEQGYDLDLGTWRGWPYPIIPLRNQRKLEKPFKNRSMMFDSRIHETGSIWNSLFKFGILKFLNVQEEATEPFKEYKK
jgi:hypothetical protein